MTFRILSHSQVPRSHLMRTFGLIQSRQSLPVTFDYSHIFQTPKKSLLATLTPQLNQPGVETVVGVVQAFLPSQMGYALVTNLTPRTLPESLLSPSFLMKTSGLIQYPQSSQSQPSSGGQTMQPLIIILMKTSGIVELLLLT